MKSDLILPALLPAVIAIIAITVHIIATVIG
jgi:hypothetical protein